MNVEHQDDYEPEINEMQEAPEEGLSDSQESAEQRARRMGWKPKEEYKGKDEWVDAETFLENTEASLPQLRASLRTIERNYSKLEKSTEAILAHQQRQIEAETKKAYDKAYSDFQARIDKGVEDGDKEAVAKAIQGREALKEREVRKTHVKEDPAVTSWKAKNTWFGKDPVLTDAAAKYTDILAREGKSVEEQLEEAEAYIKETFPHKFRQPRQAPVMPGGGNNTNKTTKIKPGSYEALTAEAKAECDRTVKDSNGKITKDDWLKYATAEMFRG